ncbi:MAG: IS701 family transposase [Mesorhizobium sp.]|nr:MAG: IS701 family transposase [Mesorhizobium sp.]
MTNWTAESEAAFDAYVDALIGVIGHADRAEPLKDYCLGLLMPLERKSVEPLAPSRVSARHQSLLHFVGQAPWSDAALLARVRDWVLPQIEQHGPIRAWIVDDTGFPKKGKHSVGVARQYCGQLGKQDNCQIAVSLSIANDAASLPIAYQLYLPHSWAEDPERCKKAKSSDRDHIPDQAADRARADQRRPRPRASRPALFWPTLDMAPTAVSARACPSSI